MHADFRGVGMSLSRLAAAVVATFFCSTLWRPIIIHSSYFRYSLSAWIYGRIPASLAVREPFILTTGSSSK